MLSVLEFPRGKRSIRLSGLSDYAGMKDGNAQGEHTTYARRNQTLG